jgi:hypothetical protein
MLPESAAVSTDIEPGLLGVKVRFGVEFVEQVAARLGSSPQKWLDYEWRKELDPPLDETQKHYEIVVEFVEMDYAELRVASSDADNRAAWPLAFALAGCLAEAYDATENPPASHAADELS